MGAAMGAAKDLNTVTVPMLVQELEIMLDALNMDTKLYSLYSLRQGGATTAYWAGVGQIDIKWQTPCHEHLLVLCVCSVLHSISPCQHLGLHGLGVD